MEKTLFLWDVEHLEHEKARVEAPDRLHAIVEAAHAWGVLMWTSVARECKTKKIGPAPARKASPARKPAQKKKPTAAKGEHHGH